MWKNLSTLEEMDRDCLPGFQGLRLVNLMKAAVARCGLDLDGLTVLTEAATGAYAVTPVIAALAGARRVHALARDSRYGSIAEVKAQVDGLATLAGVADRVRVFGGPLDELLPTVDIVTNSGHLRPLRGEVIDRLPAHAVIALMFETWEFRPGDLDLQACRRRGIQVAGVNERHPSVDVFSFLGPLAIKLLHDAGVAVYGSRVILLCDNPFLPFIERSLSAVGAMVSVHASVSQISESAADVVLVALRPGEGAVLNDQDAAAIAGNLPGAFVAQYWGDVDRPALARYGVAVWPPVEPKKGHMAILLSELGPEAVVQLQTGGLKAAELVSRHGGKDLEPGGVAEILENGIVP